MDMTRTNKAVDGSVARWAPTTLRVVAGLLWLSNVSWKVPPDFGDTGGGGCGSLCGYANAGEENTVVPGSSWLFESVVSPNLVVFGWLILFVEAGLAAALLSGRFVRTAAVIGMLQSLGIGLAVANAEGEWYWSYGLMVALHLGILVLAPALRPTPPRVAAACVAGYGVVVGLAHTSGGLTGDGSFTLFEQRNDFPGDFGRNVFPGSLALGGLLVLLGVAVWIVADRTPATAPAAGFGLVAVAALLLVTYGEDGLLLRLGSRATTAAVVAAVGLALSATTSSAVPRDGGETTPSRLDPQPAEAE
ncbi:MAG: hypothetical protein ACR2JF_14035 [Iamia sp.]